MTGLDIGPRLVYTVFFAYAKKKITHTHKHTQRTPLRPKPRLDPTASKNNQSRCRPVDELSAALAQSGVRVSTMALTRSSRPPSPKLLQPTTTVVVFSSSTSLLQDPRSPEYTATTIRAPLAACLDRQGAMKAEPASPGEGAAEQGLDPLYTDLDLPEADVQTSEVGGWSPVVVDGRDAAVLCA